MIALARRIADAECVRRRITRPTLTDAEMGMIRAAVLVAVARAPFPASETYLIRQCAGLRSATVVRRAIAEPLSFVDIGRRLGISRQKARYRHGRGIVLLRKAMGL